MTLIYQEKLAYKQCFTTEGQSVSYFKSLYLCNELHFQNATFVLASVAIILYIWWNILGIFINYKKKYVMRITFNK